MAATQYADIIQPPFGTGPNLMPGMSQVLYFIGVNDILSFGAVGTTEPEKYTIKTPITLKPGKRFSKMYSGIEKGQLKFEALGGRDATGFKITGTSFIPGDSNDLNYFTNECQGDRFIVIMPRADGKMIMVGTENFPATMRAAHDSETVTGDASGYAVNIEAYSPYKYIYDAAVQLTATQA